LLAVLNEPYLLDGVASEVRVTASIGIAVGDRATAGELLRDADLALYRAKGAGKNCYRMFAQEMQTAVRDRVQLENDLGDAVARDEFFLMYQPIFDLRASAVIGVEALLRWQHPTRGLVMPDDFIPVMEETGMIVGVGRWVLQQACLQARSWYDAGHRIDMSVNLSLRQLESDRLVDDVHMALASAGLDPASLILEITETAIMRDVPNTVRRLEAIKKLGVRIAIDDFGTGYSSLAYLQQFPVDAIKIDRAFISGIAESSEATALLRTLIQLGKTLGLSTLAEGIEDNGQYAALRNEDCENGQGFLLARPLDAAALEAFLNDRDKSPSPVASAVTHGEAAL
jgi:EAL domain-containing protein (putative c-di-GMP-specific phosphodiesterase class I)